MDRSIKSGLPVRQWAREHSTGLLVLACSILLLQNIFGSHGLMAMRRAQRETARVRQEITQTNQENNLLEQHIHALKTDPDTIECLARERMGLARPGEKVFKLPEGSAPAGAEDPCFAPSPSQTPPQH